MQSKKDNKYNVLTLPGAEAITGVAMAGVAISDIPNITKQYSKKFEEAIIK